MKILILSTLVAVGLIGSVSAQISAIGKPLLFTPEKINQLRDQPEKWSDLKAKGDQALNLQPAPVKDFTPGQHFSSTDAIEHDDQQDIALSLHERTENGKAVLDILVTNVSASAVEIVSEGIAPPWSVWAWFQWEVDGKPAEYLENIAGNPNAKESWRIPKGGVVLWASIPIRSLQQISQNAQGQKQWRSAITDKKRHSVTIMPGTQWQKRYLSLLDAATNSPQAQEKIFKIGSGSIELGQADTKSPVGGDGKPASQP